MVKHGDLEAAFNKLRFGRTTWMSILGMNNTQAAGCDYRFVPRAHNRSASRCILVAVVVLSMGFALPAEAKDIRAADVHQIMQKVADWQIETFDDMGKYRALSSIPKAWQNREKYHELSWQCGALYIGMYKWSQIAGDPKYSNWLKSIGDRNAWRLHERPYHADDQVVGQFYLSLYQQLTNRMFMQHIEERCDWILAHPKNGTLDWDAKSTHAHERWGWCDALFMAPPLWAKLASITGDPKYLAFMDREYHATYDLLWDSEEHLFWRDSSFFNRRETNGKKLFWSRGNGWVFAGLALMITDLPKNWSKRPFYLKTFRQMASKLVTLQRPDGTWSMGLLGGAEGYPLKETSGTCMFVYGLAWGINEGILDGATYAPATLKGWTAIQECVTDDGMLGYVQPVGAAPGDSFPNYTEVYGTGAFLAAGSEILRFLSPNQDIAAASVDRPEKKPNVSKQAGRETTHSN